MGSASNKGKSFGHLIFHFYEIFRGLFSPEAHEDKSLEWRRPKKTEEF